MIDASGTARIVADTLVERPDQKTIEIETPGMSSSEVLALVDAIYTKCEAAGVMVKGVKVDPMQLGLPENGEFLNGFLRNGRLIIVDLEVDHKVIVRRK
jgi:hypothetical protein